MFKKIIKFILIVFIFQKKIGFRPFINNYNKKSNNVIYISSVNGVLSNEVFIWEMSTIYYFTKNSINFRLSTNLNKIKSSKIFWSPAESIFKKKPKNYSNSIISIAKKLESNNFILPSSSEMKFWENKAYMHRIFKEKEILHPLTRIISTNEEIPKDLTFPILLKGEFSSGSKDIFKINDYEELHNIIERNKFVKRFDNYIFQELLDMRKDLRVTIVNKEVVLSYWRINPSDEWKPTASSFGSFIEFDDYPDQWNSYFFEVMQKLNLKMAAFDYAWQDDDLSSKPYLLEVSPRFSPNPVYKSESVSYGLWKKKLLLKNSYVKLQSELICDISSKYLDSYFNY